MKWIKILVFFLAISLGVFLFIYGERDDSPGCQLLSVLVVIVTIIFIIKRRKKF